MTMVLGYVVRDKEMTTCRSGAYSPAVSQMACVEAAVLVAGGYRRNPNSFLTSVEVFGANGLKKTLSNLPVTRYAHTLEYANGELYACGGYSGNSNRCWKGTYQSSSKGKEQFTSCSLSA